MTNLDSILKSRDITLPTKVRLVKVMVFPAVMYESWIINKAECQRTDTFKPWCSRRFLRVPWTARRSNQSILKEIHPEYSLEGLIWKWNSNSLAPWCKELIHLKRPCCWEGLGAGGEGENRGWDGWMASLTRWTWVWVSSRSWWWTGRPWRAVVHGVAKSRPRLSDWTELNGFQRELTETQSDCHGGIEERGRTNLGFNTYLCFCNLFHCNNVTWGQQISHNLHLFSVLTINHRPSRDNWKGTVAFGKIFFSETN